MADSHSGMWADYPFPLISTPAVRGDYTDKYTKSATKMALAHNIIIRGMNAIYLQCTFITPSTARAFMTFCECWSEFIHNHHACEEVTYFPYIEKQVGLEGIADTNLEQHQAFEAGLERFDDYISRVHPDEFSGLHLIQILDSFAAVLQIHLTDEIVWILSLSQYPQLDIEAIDASHGAYVKQNSTHLRILPFLLTNHDTTYEHGIHNWWPSGNPIREFYLRYICTFPYKAAWAYSSCHYSGKPKPLQGVSWAALVSVLDRSREAEAGPQLPPAESQADDSRSHDSGSSGGGDNREPHAQTTGEKSKYSHYV